MESIFFRRYFWGILLVVVGGIWLLENIFDFDFPLFRVLFSLALIAVGILLIKGIHIRSQVTSSRTMFGEADYKMQAGDHEHTVMFGQVKVDLSSIPVIDGQTIYLRCIFGEMKVLLPQGLNYEIRGEFAFSSATMPDGSTQNFGQKTYQGGVGEPEKPTLKIHAVCTFGSMVFLNR